MSDTSPETSVAEDQPVTPNLDKLSAVHETTAEIYDFVVEFLMSKGIFLAERDGHGDLAIVHRENVVPRLLHEYYGIDHNAVETERQALLTWVRQKHGAAS